MDIEGRILQSLRPRRDGILVRSDVNDFGSPTQVFAALKALVEKVLITRLDCGVYAKPDKVAQIGRQAMLKQAVAKMQKKRTQDLQRARQRRSDPTAIYVRQLAKREGIAFAPTCGPLGPLSRHDQLLSPCAV